MFYTNWWLRGKTLHLKYVNSQGIRQRETRTVSPTLYVHAKPKGVETTEHRDIHGKPVYPIEFSTPKDAREFVEYYKDTTSFKIFGFNRFDYTVINEIFPGKVQYDFTRINIGYIDIETEIGETFASADDPHQRINAISLYYNGKLHTWSLYDVKDSYFCKSEKQLLETFLTHWKIADLDIISGWNSQGFDMPYIAKRIELVLGEGREHDLSPFPGGVSYRQVETKYGQLQTQVSIAGVAQLDLLELYRKFVLQKQETYKLDFIAQKDLGVGKLEFDGTLKDLYEKEPEKFIEYNRIDVERVIQINEKRRLIENAIGIAYTSKCQYEDAFLTTRPWDVIIANHLNGKNIQVPFIGGGEKEEKFEGAFVKEPITGVHDWFMSFDLASLYPSIMITYNISPETMLDPDEFIRLRPDDVINETEKYKTAKAKADSLNATLCANGAMFHKNFQGFIPELVDDKLSARKVAKRAMMDWKSEAERVKEEMKRRGIK